MEAVARRRSLIRAILFDCNGIIADDEPIHLELFQKVLREEGIVLTREQYFQRYLAMDDKSCFRDVLKRHRRPASPAAVRRLIERKADDYRRVIGARLKIFPGVVDFVKRHKKDYGMAVVSGALRHEIELILARAGILGDFEAVVSAEDVRNGKPDPECYKKGLARLNRLPRFRARPLAPSECLAVEDSIHGVESAHGAGMKCLAVTNSYSKADLHRAERVVKRLSGLEVRKLEKRF